MAFASVSLATPDSRHSSASHLQRRSVPDRSTYNSGDPHFSRRTENTSAEHQLSKIITAQSSMGIDQQIVDKKMEEAEQALRDLHSQGYDFNQIVKAGLHPGVLRKLYSKIEAPVRAPLNVVQRKIVKPGSMHVATESAPGVASRLTASPQKDTNGDVFDIDTFPHVSTEEVKINGRPTIVPAKHEGKSMQNQASLVTSSKSCGVNPVDKASSIKASETKILDRKDYIARMLAAKTGKSAASASVPVSSKPSTNKVSGVSAQLRSSVNSVAITPGMIQQAPREVLDTTSEIRKDNSDAEAKRKAQTDLARQKIEALKLRDAFPQQAQSGASNDLVSQSPAKGVPDIPTEGPAPTRQPLPSRQSSYFSPASQKPSFSIPGLFMTSAALQPANTSQPPVNEGFAVSSQKVHYATSGSAQEGPHSHATVPAQSLTGEKTSSVPEIALGTNSPPPAIIPTTEPSNRKRQKASDFIDSPASRVKRPLGQQEDTSVIIDISDDEFSHNNSEDEFSGTEHIADRRGSLTSRSRVTALGNGKENSIKSLPPLIDFPQSKKPVMITPPTAIHTYGQGGDLKGLKSKEMEIEAINRKIAELEQRIAIKAKQTISRNHSPGTNSGTSSHVTVSPPPGEASKHMNGALNMPLSVSGSQNGKHTHVEYREPFTALTKTNKAATAEQSKVEQQLDEVERAKVRFERSSSAEISLASAADHLPLHEEELQIMRNKERSQVREGEQRFKEEEQRLKEIQSQQPCGEEAQTFQQQEAGPFLQEQEQRLAQEPRHESLQEQGPKRSLEDLRQARKFEIESGLPLLDAEVEKTRRRLDSLRQEIADLESQLQKGIEGRQDLIKELNDLSRARETLSKPVDLDSCDVSNVRKPSNSNEEIPGKCPCRIWPLMCSKQHRLIGMSLISCDERFSVS